MTFEAALHTYLAVADARTAVVRGLEGHRYLDKTGGPDPVPASGEPVRLSGETDRIYLETSGTHDRRGPRRWTDASP